MSFEYDIVPQGTQITDCCRICLADTELMDMKSNEFSNNERALNYYQLFRECSGLQTNEIFILPTGKGQNAFKICNLCIVQLESCYTFRDLCRQANTILTDRYLMQAHNEGGIDEEGQNMKEIDGSFLSTSHFSMYGAQSAVDPRPMGKHQCPKCPRTFKYLSLLNQHSTTHAPPKVRKYRCQICMASYKHHLSLQSHMRTAHFLADPNSPIERRGRKPGPIIRPPRIMDGMDTTPAATDENGLIIDIKPEPQDEVANGDSQAYNCADCEQTFQDVIEYNQHMAEHKRAAGVDEEEANDGGDESCGGSSTSGSQKTKCGQCSAGPFRTPSGLYHHMQTTHNLLRFTCTYCLKQFTRKQTLNDHNCKAKQMAQHSMMTAVHAPAMMTSAEATARAVEASQGTGTLNCPYCDYETDMRENFQEHLDEVHSHNFNYNGQQEQPAYDDNSMMHPEIGMTEESGEQNEDMRMFYANLMSPQVTMKTDFDNNVSDNSVNAAEVPPPIILSGDSKNKFQCGECLRTFQYMSYYKQHMISHSTAKNFKCNICPSSYKHEKSLMEHMVKHQPPQPHDYPYRAFASINPAAIHAASMMPTPAPAIIKPSAPPPYGFTPIKIEAASSLADLSMGPSAENSENEAGGTGEGGGDNEMTDDSFAGGAGETIQKDPRTGKFYCKICDRHYQYLSNYKQHMVKHSDVKKYKCTLCPMTYKTEKSYIGHMKGHADGLIPAKPMNVETPTKPKASHLQMDFQPNQKENTDQNFYQCKQCDKKLQSQGGLYHHVQTVHKHFRFFCKLCHQTFTTKKSLQRHMFTHKERAFMYNCTEPGCKFFTNIRQRLAVHLINAHNLKYKEELHGCLRDMGDTRRQIAPPDGTAIDDNGDQNNVTSYSAYADDDEEDQAMDYPGAEEDGEPEQDYEGDEEQPEGDEQPDEQNSADDGESQSMTIAPEVILHESMDSELDNEGSQHDPLDANPSTSSGIRRTDEDDCMIVADDDVLAMPPSAKRQHTDFMCPQCNQGYVSHQELMHHISMVHSNAMAPMKRFKCPACPAAFTVEKNLEFHMKTHKTPGREPHGDPENMVKCPQCDKTLFSKSGLYHHIKSRHEGVKYACKLCEKEFTTKDMLWQHSFHHREDCPWPFICKEENCEFRTKGKSLYQTHLKTVHGLKYDDQIHGYHDLSFQQIIDSVLDRSKLKHKKIRMS